MGNTFDVVIAAYPYAGRHEHAQMHGIGLGHGRLTR
jgi:hypothetical protein